MEDGSLVRDDRVDGSFWFGEWAWEKYGPKETDEGQSSMGLQLIHDGNRDIF